MNKAKQILLRALSDPEARLDVEKSRKLMNLKTLDPLKPFYRNSYSHLFSGYRVL